MKRYSPDYQKRGEFIHIGMMRNEEGEYISLKEVRCENCRYWERLESSEQGGWPPSTYGECNILYASECRDTGRTAYIYRNTEEDFFCGKFEEMED